MTSLWIKNNIQQASPTQLDTLKREGEAFLLKKTGSTHHLMFTPCYIVMYNRLPAVFVVHLCPHNNFDKRWMWTHCFTDGDYRFRIHVTHDAFFA